MTPVQAVSRALCKLTCARWNCIKDMPCTRWPDKANVARAVLAAIRTPTPGMVEAMRRYAVNAADGYSTAGLFAAAIGAAMEE